MAKIPNRRFTKSDQRLLREVAKRVDSLRPGLLEKADRVFAIPDKCKPHRASKDLKLLRTLTLAELLIEGWNWSQLLPHAAERWGVNERQLRTYFREAEALVAKEYARRREALFGIVLARIDRLYSLAAETGNLRAVSASIDHLIQVAGLGHPATQRIEIVGRPRALSIQPAHNHEA